MKYIPRRMSGNVIDLRYSNDKAGEFLDKQYDDMPQRRGYPWSRRRSAMPNWYKKQRYAPKPKPSGGGGGGGL